MVGSLNTCSSTQRPALRPPKAASEILSGRLWHTRERTLKSGPRKGLSLTEWDYTDDPEVPVWDRIVAAYAKAGLSEADALAQARCARILRNTDWDGSHPILWEPGKLAH